MPAQSSFDYAIIRVVPHVERGECINAGIILYCREQRFLEARIDLDKQRLLALCPEADVKGIQALLDVIPRVCAGEGPIGQLSQSERFHWLVSPSSTMVQTSPVHTGLSSDPSATLEHLLQTLVKRH